MGLVGPNGAGKTTTLRCLSGIIPATTGHARIGGVDVAADPVAAKRQLAFIPDEPRLFDHLTVEQHLNFVARLRRRRRLARTRAAAARRTGNGRQAQAAAGRALARDEAEARHRLRIAARAARVILDEPLTGLDPGIRRMKDTMRRLAGEGAAIILSSHLLDLVEEVCTTC